MANTKNGIIIVDVNTSIPIGMITTDELLQEIGDGMVDDVKVEDGYLIIVFNTESGKQPISIPLSELAPPMEDYYTKTETDEEISKAIDDIDIPVVPANVSAFNNDAGYLTQHQSLSNYVQKSSTSGLIKNDGTIDTSNYLTQHQDITGKYDKTGGDINGNVKVFGDFKLDIEDEDYDAGVTFNRSLDNNLGTILTLQGYAGNTNYKPIVRNIGTPNANYDVANKKYVDDHIVLPNYYLVSLNTDGTVDQKASALTYATVSSHLTNASQEDWLDVMWEVEDDVNARFHVPCTGVSEVNHGTLVFSGLIWFNNTLVSITFTLDEHDTLTTVAIIPTPESLINKVQSIISNSTSTINYPSTKAVYDEFQRKPQVIWETDGVGLTGLDTDMSASPNWQLTNLDFSPYSYVKIYTKAAQKSGTTASASTTPAIVLEMSLDSRAASPYGGHYLASNVFQKSNDANRLATLCCAISADKTSFAVIRMTTLYGTAATSNSDVGAYVFKIVGYYD